MGQSRRLTEATAVITALILDRPMCHDCLATKGGVSLREGEAILERIAAVLELHREVARCRACGGIARVVSVDPAMDNTRHTST